MQLKQHDLTGALQRGLQPIYLVNTDDPLLQEETCDAILAAARAQQYDERTVMHVDPSFDWSTLQQDASALSLFASRRIFDLRNPGGKFDKEASAVLRSYTADLPPDTLLLIRSARLDGRQRQSAWFKALDAAGVIVTIYDVAPQEMPRWLRGRLKQAGLALSNEALAYLSEKVEGNLLAARQHIDKLKLQNLAEPVSLEDLMACIEDASSYGAFDLANAVLGGEQARVVRALRSLQDEGLSVFPVLGAVGASLRNVLAGRTRFGPLADLARNFQRRQSRDAIALAIGQLALIDAQGKGQLLGNEWESLERLLLNLAGDGRSPLPTLDDFRPLLTRR
jgi:DNA polymerase-3 subunit delta